MPDQSADFWACSVVGGKEVQISSKFWKNYFQVVQVALVLCFQWFAFGIGNGFVPDSVSFAGGGGGAVYDACASFVERQLWELPMLARR